MSVHPHTYGQYRALIFDLSLMKLTEWFILVRGWTLENFVISQTYFHLSGGVAKERHTLKCCCWFMNSLSLFLSLPFRSRLSRKDFTSLYRFLLARVTSNMLEKIITKTIISILTLHALCWYCTVWHIYLYTLAVSSSLGGSRQHKRTTKTMGALFRSWHIAEVILYQEEKKNIYIYIYVG